MTTKDDIETGGGTCDYVATDFWECTDSDGTIWWCNHEGCTKKPTRLGATSGIMLTVPLQIYIRPDKDNEGHRIAVLPGTIHVEQL